MNQLALPIKVSPEEVERKPSLGAAIELCAELAGYTLDKSLQREMAVDKAQFSRWTSGQEGIVWPKFAKLMDVCGNDAPLSAGMTFTACTSARARRNNRTAFCVKKTRLLGAFCRATRRKRWPKFNL